MAANTTHSNNTIKTRIQLKSDTEANWNKAGPKDGSNGFIPLLGEFIVYTSDDTHPFSRLKIGDGNTNVVDLPFIDAGTISGSDLPSASVVMYANRDLFPSPNESNKLYVDLATNIIYCYTLAGGYTQLSNFTYSTEKTTVSSITSWNAGATTTLLIQGGILTVINGTAPSLEYESPSVVTNITKEVITL